MRDIRLGGGLNGGDGGSGGKGGSGAGDGSGGSSGGCGGSNGSGGGGNGGEGRHAFGMPIVARYTHNWLPVGSIFRTFSDAAHTKRKTMAMRLRPLQAIPPS